MSETESIVRSDRARRAVRRAERRGVRAILVGVLLTMAALPGSAAIRTVGSDVSCEFPNVPFALAFSSDGDTLQLQGETFVGFSGNNFNLVTKNLVVEGGYDGCSGELGDTPTVLRGGGGGSVLTLNATSPRTAVFRHLTIEGGTSDGGGGAGIEIDGQYDVQLEWVIIRGNVAEDEDLSADGGGIHLEGSSAKVTVGFGTSLQHNHGRNGGGLYCAAGAEVVVQAVTSWIGNEASVAGGGMYLDDCTVVLQSSNVLLSSNQGGLRGGAIAAVGGTHLDGWADGELTPWIYLNGASEGGGIYAEGPETFVRLLSAVIENNVAETGGGVFADDAIVVLAQDGSGAPPSALFDNEATTGGGAAGFDGARIFFTNALMAGNEAEDGALAWMDDSDLYLEGAAILQNFVLTRGQGDLVVSNGVGEVGVHGTTLRTNYGAATLFAVQGEFEGEGLVVDAGQGTVFALGTGATWSLNCAVLPIGTTLPGAVPNLVLGAPGFASADGITIAEDSPAVDLCGSTSTNYPEHDLHGDPRPSGGSDDAGADELVPPLFRDGFETGNTSAWQ